MKDSIEAFSGSTESKGLDAIGLIAFAVTGLVYYFRGSNFHGMETTIAELLRQAAGK